MNHTNWAPFTGVGYFTFHAGVGALYVRRRPRVRLEALISGGGQERYSKECCLWQ